MLKICVFVFLGFLAQIYSLNETIDWSRDSRFNMTIPKSNRPVFKFKSVDVSSIERDPQFHIELARAYSGARDDTRDALSDTALKLWMESTFFEQFFDFSVLQNSQQIQAGKSIFERMASGGFILLVGGDIIRDMPVDDIRKVVDGWYEGNVIGQQARDEVSNALGSSQFAKTSKGAVGVNGALGLSFAQVGYITMDIFSGKKGSIGICYSQLYLMSPMSTQTQSTSDCWLWGTFCENKYEVPSLSPADALNMAAYLRHRALSDWYQDYGRQILIPMKDTAERYYPFLPMAQKSKVDEMKQRPKVRPDTYLSEDPFDGNKLPWSTKL